MKETKDTETISMADLDIDLNISSKKYIRTSFNLPKQIIDYLSTTTKYFRKSKKDLLSTILENEKVLDEIVKALGKSKDTGLEKFARHSVYLNKKAHSVLDLLSKRYRVTKSAIVALVIIMLKSHMDEILKAHGEALELVKEFQIKYDRYMGELSKILPTDSPVYSIAVDSHRGIEDSIFAIEDEISNKVYIDETEYGYGNVHAFRRDLEAK